MTAPAAGARAASRVTVRTAREYARELVPHLEHPSYRCDDPAARLMGRGCAACGVEVVVAIPDFRASGDLEAYGEELKPYLKKGGR